MVRIGLAYFQEKIHESIFNILIYAGVFFARVQMHEWILTAIVWNWVTLLWAKKLLYYVNTINNNIDTLEKESRSTR